MAVPYYHLMGQIYVAHRAVRESSELFDALIDTSFSRRRLEREEQNHPLVERGIALADERIETLETNNRAEHQTHTSIEEVDMWWQRARFEVQNAAGDEPPDGSAVAKAIDPEFHSDDHGVSVTAKALRMLSMIRAAPPLRELLGEGRKTRDLLIRGWTLLKKLYDNSELLVEPLPENDPEAEIFVRLRRHRQRMSDWVRSLEAAAHQLVDRPSFLGELGYVPEETGIPLGGTGYSITLHENAQTEAPDPDRGRPAPGWSVGRESGRNSENMGEGWIDRSERVEN